MLATWRHPVIGVLQIVQINRLRFGVSIILTHQWRRAKQKSNLVWPLFCFNPGFFSGYCVGVKIIPETSWLTEIACGVDVSPL